LAKFSTFDRNIDFWSKFQFLTNVSIFDQSVEFWTIFWIFDQNLKFRPLTKKFKLRIYPISDYNQEYVFTQNKFLIKKWKFGIKGGNQIKKAKVILNPRIFRIMAFNYFFVIFCIFIRKFRKFEDSLKG